MRRIPTTVAAALLIVGSIGLAPASRLDVMPAQASFATGWTTYHFDNARSGNDTGEPAMTTQNGAAIVSGGLDEKLQAAPLVYSGLVFAATENDTVYALNETDLSQRWSTHLGSAVAYNPYPQPFFCEGSHLGNAHVGITGTPVIDTATGLLYAVGLVSAGNGFGMKYQLYTLRVADGVQTRAPIDLDYADIDPRAEGQRSALILANGYTYIAFGGRDGDCPPYHPVVVAVSTTTGTAVHWDPQTGGQSEAGIWGPSGFAADASGNVYVTTGNGAETSCSNPWDHGDGTIKFTAPLTEAAAWKPSNWCTLNQTDADLGSIGPSLLSGGYLFQDGKPGNGYLINSSNMAQVGNQFHITGCQTNDAIFGGNAYDGNHVYVPCDSLGVVALNINPANATPISVAWSPPGSGYSPGPPILAGGYIWATNQFGGTLHRITPDGMTDTTFTTGTGSRFNTPAADSGRIFIAQTTSIRELNFGNVTPPAPPPISTYTVFRNESLHLDYWDDGNTWYEIDGNLRLTIVPPVAETAIVSINIDLWTTQAGYNQDVGIFMIDNGSADQLLAWKESGGYAGTFSPNAAMVQTVVNLAAGHTYTFKLKLKSNKPASGGTVYGAAGTAQTQFSPTRLTAHLVPTTSVYTRIQNQSYHLDSANDGGFGSWAEIDPALDVTVPGSSATAIATGNMDLWTTRAGYNQDLGLFVSDNGGPDQQLAWKESGGFAGTYSPNAAFVQFAYSMAAGHNYTFKLKWKPNISAPGGTLYGAAGTTSSGFSPTRLTVQVVPAASLSWLRGGSSYNLGSANDGGFGSWVELNPQLRVPITPAAGSTAIVGANMDLWTSQAGYNQDLGIFVCDSSVISCASFTSFSLLAWKESGGFAGTFSPNAAYAHTVYGLTGGHAYVFALGWKPNTSAPAGVIYGAAGTAQTQFSPTSLLVELAG